MRFGYVARSFPVKEAPMGRRIWLGKSGRHILCVSGRPNTCNNFTLLVAEQSDFYTEPLQGATEEINAILARVREQAPDGLHLALIDTRDGLLFVWAEAAERPGDI